MTRRSPTIRLSPGEVTTLRMVTAAPVAGLTATEIDEAATTHGAGGSRYLERLHSLGLVAEVSTPGGEIHHARTAAGARVLGEYLAAHTDPRERAGGPESVYSGQRRRSVT